MTCTEECLDEADAIYDDMANAFFFVCHNMAKRRANLEVETRSLLLLMVLNPRQHRHSNITANECDKKTRFEICMSSSHRYLSVCAGTMPLRCEMLHFHRNETRETAIAVFPRKRQTCIHDCNFAELLRNVQKLV